MFQFGGMDGVQPMNSYAKSLMPSSSRFLDAFLTTSGSTKRFIDDVFASDVANPPLTAPGRVSRQHEY
jgi:hypothetical protein